ncbi:hypothetical protein [Novosphingobium aquimarinum]|uniref:hypothetical protein n=1 Tax=Novosphingobium aquimarinum TaxID=2682494 RepID=UPI0012EB29A4|nr:hypothetical protein [Novosphingobium aquimarinum]
MIAVVLGMPGSASTWIFNVVRELVAGRGEPAVSLYADRAQDLLTELGTTDARHVVIKAHSLDPQWLALLRVSGGHLIVSTRDPRDSLLSMQDRFGHAAQDVTRQIALSVASIAVVRSDVPRHLHLAYETRFARRKSTIGEIAAFLSIERDPSDYAAIFEKLKVASVRSHTASLAELGYEPDWFDPATHWHPNHVGDGRVRKWTDRLSAQASEAYCEAFAALSKGEYRQDGSIRWQPELFSYHDAADADGARSLTAAEPACLVFGPYFYLPPGRWRASVALEADTVAPLRVEIVSETRVVLAMRQVTISSASDGTCVLDFEVADHTLPLEARVHAMTSDPLTVRFGGVGLEWIGPLPRAQRVARPL